MGRRQEECFLPLLSLYKYTSIFTEKKKMLKQTTFSERIDIDEA